ncbi:MAG TPA: stage II sporulation protein M [Verrucomicrobiae bacterium]|jgi:stage II sporulation protein M|nr:stage II sporulation protein M [Verrucomicrobiae bacterium]
MTNERHAWSWREHRHYLRELTPYLLTSVGLLLAAALVGVATSTQFAGFSTARREALGEFASLFVGLPRPLLALAIFFNNALKTLIVILTGRLAGILPLIFLLINGYVLGIVFYATFHSKGLWSFLLAIAPHGVLELPAVLLGTAIGLKLGTRAITRFIKKDGFDLSAELARGLRFFFAVIIPLLTVSALIEAFITAALAGK